MGALQATLQLIFSSLIKAHVLHLLWLKGWCAGCFKEFRAMEWVEEFGVNHVDIISDMITLWSGTAETIWGPLPALYPPGALAFAGLLAVVSCKAAAYKTWDRIWRRKRTCWLTNGSEEVGEASPSWQKQAKYWLMLCDKLPVANQMHIYCEPMLHPVLCLEVGSNEEHAPGLLRLLIWKGKQWVIKSSW